MLDHLFKGTAFTQPTNIYVALFTVTPNSTGNGTEVTGGAYARVACNTWVAATAADPSVVSNTAEIDFPTATASWGSVVAFGLFSASTAGTMYAYGTCTKTINNGDTAKFLASQLTLSLNET